MEYTILSAKQTNKNILFLFILILYFTGMLYSVFPICKKEMKGIMHNAPPLWQHGFFGNRLTVSLHRTQALWGGIFTAALLAMVLFQTAAFSVEIVSHGTLLLVLSLIACVILGMLTIFRWRLKGRADTIVSITVFCLLPIVAMTMVECLNGVFTWDWTPQTLLLNYILYFIFYGTVYIFSGSLRLPMLICNPLFFLLGLVNHYVKAFRGTPFLPLDLFGAGTAANVAVAYDFSPDYQVIIAVILLAFLQIAAFKLHTPKLDTVMKVASRTFFGTLIVCVVSLYIFTDQYAKVGLKPDFWNQSRGYRNTGVVLNFCLNTKYLHFSAPKDYDAGEIEDIVYGVLEADRENTVSVGTSADNSKKTPNIICIMNESLSDLNVLGEVQTNIDYMPFLRSLTENTVRGNLYVPVIGSGTSNTEFEFLTGISTAFFPAGSNAYMLYMDDPIPSLVSTLSSQNYSRRAFHPYYASGWNRIKVYENLGFQRFSSISSVISNDILLQYQQSGYDAALLEQLVSAAYPGQDVLLRRYVSDSYNYDKVIEMYEQRDPDTPFFLFNVTMQNHGGYTEKSDNFQQEVYITDANGEAAAVINAAGQKVYAWPKANQFLSLIKRSDEAFEELISYFSQQEEPTVICMFGDHQPNIETDYIAQLLGVSSLYSTNLQQTQQRYITPFYIWANFPIEEKTIDMLSVNYLSSYMLEIAGVNMPVYNEYLLALSRQLPVINSIGYIDINGQYYEKDDVSVYTPLLEGYEKVAYNLLFDDDNRKNNLFTLSQ